MVTTTAARPDHIVDLTAKQRVTRERVLVVEDAPEIVLLLQSALERDGFDVDAVQSGERALEFLTQHTPLAVVLDIGLPGIDGFETCRRIRAMSDVHVIMLTARDDESDKLVGFAIGADDYVTKPASVRELSARLRSVARRRSGSRGEKLAIGPLNIDLAARTVDVGTERVQLTRIEFELFLELVRRVDAVVPRSDLQALVWGAQWHGGEHLVEVHISNLRRKLTKAGAPNLIRTVREVGYRLESSARPA